VKGGIQSGITSGYENAGWQNTDANLGGSGIVWAGSIVLGAASIAGVGFGALASGARKLGGAYNEIRGLSGYEAHHIPANSISPIARGEGPAIAMEQADHQATASWGNSKEAQAYRQQQADLIAQGKFSEAQQMDINDIQQKFGNKYDDAIQQMLDYTKGKGY
jgi:hypothetical protein